VFQRRRGFVQIQGSRFSIQILAYGGLVLPAHHLSQAFLSTHSSLDSLFQRELEALVKRSLHAATILLGKNENTGAIS
jgi:hypothetical protein